MSKHHTNFSPKSKDGLSAQEGIFPIYKKAGETLAELILRFRQEQSLSGDLPITYAGRLDPMADGLVLLLTGEMCKQKDNFLGLDKTYVFEVLFGVSTDTFDMLGIVTESSEYIPTEEQIKSSIEKIKNTKEFPYPPFSSKPVNGKPLFVHAKEGTLPKQMPTIKGVVDSSILQNTRVIRMEDAVREKIEIVKKVQGDFRQKEIIDSWNKILEKYPNRKCLIATFEATVSSGIYIRTLANIFGGLAYSIKRVRIGDFEL